MICPHCQQDFIKTHFNQKYCKKCRVILKKNPKHNLTSDQIKQFNKYLGKFKAREIADKIKASITSVKRYAMTKRISLRKPRYTQHEINEVIEYYIKHGLTKTKIKFPKIRPRSIIEHNYHIPLRIRWTNNQVIELAKMAGIISREAQARYFNRPNAHLGSIKSVWVKKLVCSQANINGLNHNIAKYFVKKNEAYISVKFGFNNNYNRKLLLWVDVIKYLKPDTPTYLKDAFYVMAKFQKWLHGRNVRHNIKHMIKEREYD